MSVDTPGNSHAVVTRRLPAGVDQLPSGAFRARVASPDGKQVSLGTFPNMTVAGRAVQQARADLARGGWIDPRRGQITLDAWITEWMPNRQIREYTRLKDEEKYRCHIKPYLASVPLNRITNYRVETWLAQLANDGHKPPTVTKAHGLLRTALGVKGAIGDQRMLINPCLTIRPPRHEHVEWALLTGEQINQILEHVDQRWRPLVTVLADTGVRWSEMCGLQRSDFNPLRQTLTVTRTRDPKGRTQPTKNRHSRTIPLSTRATTALNQAAEGKHPNGWLFTAPRGGTLSASSWRYRFWVPAIEAAEISARIHDLRHSCASRLLKGGATVAEVRDLLGHSSIVVTERYLHVDRATLADVVVKALG